MATTPIRYVRDRTVAVTFVALGMWGYALYAMGPTLAALRDDLGVSRSAIGAASTTVALGSIAASLAAPGLLARLSQRAVLMLAMLAIGVAMVGLASAWSLAAVLIAAAVLGAAGALATIVVPVVIDSHQPAARAVALTEANFCAAAAGVASPLAIGAAIALTIGWQAGLALGAVAAIAAAGFVLTLRPPAPTPATRVTGDAADETRSGGGFWRWWVAVVCGVAAEFCVSFWAADFMRTEVAMSKGLASGLVGVFVAGIAVGRFGGGRMARTRPPRHLVAAAFATLLVGCGVFWAFTTVAGSVVGLALLGLGVSVIYPLCLSLAIGAAPRGTAPRAATIVSLGTSSAILVAPFLLGTLGDAVGPRRGFLLVPAIVAVALVLVVTARDEAAPAT